MKLNMSINLAHLTILNEVTPMKKLLCFFMLLFSQSSLAADPIYTGFFSNKAVGGYDTVDYFREGKLATDNPLKGKDNYVMSYMGADWYFSSQENLDSFSKNPTKYVPQYGGFCAWAISEKNDRASGDPLQWTIVKGKLYLNYDAEVKGWWEKNIPLFITKADKNWPSLLKK